jgi:hypothetical protein
MGGATMRRVLVVGLFVGMSLLGVSFAECPSADFSGNCFVDLEDFATLSAAWLSDDTPTPNWNPACDISDPSDGVIDELDLAILAADWLEKCTAFVTTKGTATVVVASSTAPASVKKVADYVCDGTADNVQIQAAITALATYGGTVVLSDGTFNLIAALTLGNNLRLSGQGPATILKVVDDVQDIAITNTDRSGGNTDITLENFTINGNKENQDGPGSPATYGDLYGIYITKYSGSSGAGLGCVDFRNCTRVRISKVTIYDGFPSCLEMAPCNDSIITDCVMHDSGDDTIGVNVGCYDVTVANNILYNAGVSAGGWFTTSSNGVEVQDGAHNISVVGNQIRDCTKAGVEVSSHEGGGVCYDVSITGNTIRDCDVYGVVVESITDPASQHTEISITGNTFWNVGTRTMEGITLLGARYVTICGNTFNSCEFAIKFTTSVDKPVNSDVTISGNIMLGVTTNSIRGIGFVGAGAGAFTNFIVANNVFKDLNPSLYFYSSAANTLTITGLMITGNVMTTARANADGITMLNADGTTITGSMFNNIIGYNGTGQWFEGPSGSLDPADIGGTLNYGDNYLPDGSACPLS